MKKWASRPLRVRAKRKAMEMSSESHSCTDIQMLRDSVLSCLLPRIGNGSHAHNAGPKKGAYGQTCLLYLEVETHDLYVSHFYLLNCGLPQRTQTSCVGRHLKSFRTLSSRCFASAGSPSLLKDLCLRLATSRGVLPTQLPSCVRQFAFTSARVVSSCTVSTVRVVFSAFKCHPLL